MLEPEALVDLAARMPPRDALCFRGDVPVGVEGGELAEAENHHPAIVTEWGKVRVNWWTHKIHGLHKNDLILAARTDQVYAS